MVSLNREFQVFVKPVGSKCNLNCRYCYYLGKGSLFSQGKATVMTDDLLEKYIVQHIEASPDKEVFFSWHGGEPMLAGLDFFRKAVGLQDKHRPGGYTIKNGIQTNGTLINDEWANFLAGENFCVGISIDGPETLHNRLRISATGKPTFSKVIEGYNKLAEYNLVPEILCVINSVNAAEPLAVYRFFRSLGARFITFIPLVERTPSGAGAVSGDSVQPGFFGRFLCTVFDDWLENDIGRIKIQIIEEALRTAFGQEHALCIFKRVCGGVPVVDLNGDFYSCDHYVNPENLIGNISATSLSGLLDSGRQIGFGLEKRDSLPRYCQECEVRDMCNGECPKNRFKLTPAGEPGLNYLCEGYKMFFTHIRPFADAVRSEWLKNIPEDIT